MAIRDLHIFCDASEHAYWSVAYMSMIDIRQQAHVSFVLSRSHVAPKRQLYMPRLRLSAALTGVEISKVLKAEILVPIRQVILLSDSITALAEVGFLPIQGFCGYACH